MYIKQLNPGLAINDAYAQSAPQSLYSRFAKRAIDLILVIISAPIALILVGIMALLVMRSGARPFYTQKRVGLGGNSFPIFKMQTMVPQADKRLEAYLAQNPEARAEWDEHQKLKDDPRITPIGALLRRTSLDELPQLWNVFKGDMSIVGPRPMMVDQQAMYPGQAYYQLRPGITGSWQVSDRNSSSFAKRAEYDGEYLENLSLQQDVSIIWRTIGVVFKGTGY